MDEKNINKSSILCLSPVRQRCMWTHMWEKRKHKCPQTCNNTLEHYLHQLDLAKVKHSSDSTKCWQGCRAMGALIHGRWECKQVQTFLEMLCYCIRNWTCAYLKAHKFHSELHRLEKARETCVCALMCLY